MTRLVQGPEGPSSLRWRVPSKGRCSFCCVALLTVDGRTALASLLPAGAGTGALCSAGLAPEAGAFGAGLGEASGSGFGAAGCAGLEWFAAGACAAGSGLAAAGGEGAPEAAFGAGWAGRSVAGAAGSGGTTRAGAVEAGLFESGFFKTGFVEAGFRKAGLWRA